MSDRAELVASQDSFSDSAQSLLYCVVILNLIWAKENMPDFHLIDDNDLGTSRVIKSNNVNTTSALYRLRRFAWFHTDNKIGEQRR